MSRATTEFVRHLESKEHSLPGLALDGKFVLLQIGLLVSIVFFSNIALGVLASLAMLVLWKRWSTWREAVVAVFCVACILASSRVAGLQYWKTWRLFFAALVVLESLRKMREMTFEQRRNKLGFGMVILLCTGIPALLSEHKLAGLEETILLSSMWLAMLVLGRTHSEKDSASRFSTMIHFGLVIIGACLISKYASYDLSHLNGRFRGIFGNPNEFSHWWLGIFVLGLVASSHWLTQRTLALVTMTMLFYFWSGTRGASVAVVFSLLGWMVQGVRSTVLANMFKIILGLTTVLIVTAISTEELIEYLPERIIRTESLEAGGGRLFAWKHAAEQISVNPWFGSGGGAEERYFRENYSYFSMQNHQGLSHNSWLAFAMNFGVPATVVLFFVMLLRLGLLGREVFMVGFVPFVISFTVEGWLTAPMSASSPMLFFVGGLIPSLSRLNRNQACNNHEA